MKSCCLFKSILALFLAGVMLFSAVSCATTLPKNQNNNVLENGQSQMEYPNIQSQNGMTGQLPNFSGLGTGTDNSNIQNNFSNLMNADDHQIKDTDGSFTVPFDVAYPEAFEAGAFQYDPSVLLLKMDSEFDGELTQELADCGFDALEQFCAVGNGVWYRATLSEGAIITEVAAKTREVESVLMVDYDYIAQKASDDEVEILNDSVKDNPRVNEQWYLDSCHIQEAWAHLAEQGINPGGSSSVIVAVIDTGVDYTHPDLASSMWVNKGEIAGNGIDDDGNGYVDDIHGCSTIGSTYDHNGNPMDDHGHGTHVAGIIGAANNKEGIVGIAYNTKIMAIKAGQASGVFNQSDIAEAILYAYENGAEVINMSFGSTACSLAVQEALEIAWTRAVLVASAGNDGAANEFIDEDITTKPSYPAAFHFVIGVMSINRSGIESTFTNWDVTSNNSIEYEVYAPGESILSTLPNGKYGYLNGTSMAAPVVSAIAALLRSKYFDRDMYPAKFINGQITATSEKEAICCHGYIHRPAMSVNAFSALTKLPKPNVTFYDYYIFDDVSISDKNNGDGVVDAGETLYIAPVLYNRWGMSKDTIVTIELPSGVNGEKNPYVEIITASSNFESIGTYSIKDQLIRNDKGMVIGADEPLIVKIKENCPNDYIISLKLTVTCYNGLDENDTNLYIQKQNDNGQPYSITFSIRNGTKLPNLFEEDTVITNDKYYILDGTCIVMKGVTVTIQEGVQIQNEGTLSVYGNLNIKGTSTNPVVFISDGIMTTKNGGVIALEHTELSGSATITDMLFCKFNGADLVCANSIKNCEIKASKIRSPFIENSEITICDNNPYEKDLQVISMKGCAIYDGGNMYGSSIKMSICEDTLFASEKIYPDISMYINCTFINKSISPYTFSYSLNSSKFIYNEKTHTTYFELSSACNPYLVDLISNALGGTLLCIETEEEFQYIKNQCLYGICGLAYGSDQWINGVAIEDWLPMYYFPSGVTVDQIIETTSPYAMHDSRVFGKMSFWGNAQAPDDTMIFEIPNSPNLTLDKVKELLDTNEALQEYHQYLNCALVTNFNDSNNLIKVQATTQYDYENIRSIKIPNIYWGTTDLELIEAQILDFDDEPYQRDQIDPSGFLTEAPADAYPFVVDAYLLNQNGERVRTVNNETVTFVVEFNRDMNTSVPLKVTFGSSAEYFYEDYNISEHGKWVTPRRWEATYTLKTIIENGNHTIKIENGCAADNEWLKLYDVPGRFMFEIDTTAAQALIMQGHATETGIQLSWTQDDFDILMGYNVYRSDREDGYYQRLNSSVIPYDQKEFFDDTIEPGKVYYYNFTVVKTDLTESEPSGKISLMSMDTMAPNIYHSPVYSGYMGSNLIVGATVTDNLGLHEVKLYYRAVGESDWRTITMSVLNNRYTGLIAADFLSTDGIEYYIRAYDGINYTYKGTADTPFLVAIQAAVDASSLGDVDGDGIITNKDALMLLQAANDLLNLTEEQFIRADINGDGELSAAEALRILQYVSGKVTTIVG